MPDFQTASSGMLLLRVIFLWSLVSLHVVAGAVLFRRLFGRDYAWYGVVVPMLALCTVLNFIENFIPIPTLVWLLPVTTVGSVLLLLHPGFSWEGTRLRFVTRHDFSWEGLRLPVAIFLGSFAFTFFIRSIEPDVLTSSDGMVDLNLIGNFCHGETLPPTDCWMPPYKLQYYYTFLHYAASVVVRLLGVDVGTGYNISHALLSALTCYVAAAAAWRITNKIWITLVMPFVIESAATGSSAYLWLTEKDPSPWTMSDLSGGLLDPNKNPNNPIWKLLATAPYRESLRLQPPGFWTYRDEYHSNAGGHFFTIFAVWIVVELMRRERLNWSWIAALLVPILAILTSTWALPITGLLCGGGIVIALMSGRRPQNVSFVVVTAAIGLVCLWPSLFSIFSSPYSTPVIWNIKEFRTPLYEFLFQWWPIYVMWASLFFVWFKLPPGVRWVHIVVPVMLIAIENINIEMGRYNTIEKMWGYTYGAGLVAFFSVVAMRPGVGFRLLTIVILTSAAISFRGWMLTTFRWIDWQNSAWHIEGNGILRRDPVRARLLQVLGQLHNKTILTGTVIYGYNESPSLSVFSGNRTYIAWTYSEEHFAHGGENDYRAKEVNDFYAGSSPDPLSFLTGHDISGVVIWPGDAIPDTLVASLKQQLAPYYDYVDCRGDGTNNAGVFLYRPTLVVKKS